MKLWWENCDHFMEVPIFSETKWKDPFKWFPSDGFLLLDDWKCAREQLWGIKVGIGAKP